MKGWIELTCHCCGESFTWPQGYPHPRCDRCRRGCPRNAACRRPEDAA